MNFNQTWTRFALDAEVEHYGTKRIADAYNALRAENERLEKFAGLARSIILSGESWTAVAEAAYEAALTEKGEK